MVGWLVYIYNNVICSICGFKEKCLALEAECSMSIMLFVDNVWALGWNV